MLTTTQSHSLIMHRCDGQTARRKSTYLDVSSESFFFLSVGFKVSLQLSLILNLDSFVICVSYLFHVLHCASSNLYTVWKILHEIVFILQSIVHHLFTMSSRQVPFLPVIDARRCGNLSVSTAPLCAVCSRV